MSFLADHDADVAKMAIVGDEKWRESVMLFTGVGIRRSPVVYFGDEPSARSWLAAPAERNGEMREEIRRMIAVVTLAAPIACGASGAFAAEAATKDTSSARRSRKTSR